MNILITGGAGYIGSVAARMLREVGHTVTILDNLSRGFEPALPDDVRFIQADIADITEVLSTDDGIEAVIHLAAYAYVGESVQQPELYWNNNVVGTIKLLEGMRQLNIRTIVFASSCAAYGIPDRMPITEDMPARPVNAYGMTKLAMDMALTSEATAHGLAATSLRFFNVAGSYQDGGERHNPETHIIPLALAAAAGTRPNFLLYGSDYDTPDGTCVRDYIHVLDLARAMEMALKGAQAGEHRMYNLGTGTGFSNKQVIEAVKDITGSDFPVTYGDRRPGDPPTLVASNLRAKKELGWEPIHSSLEKMIGDAWRFYQDYFGEQP